MKRGSTPTHIFKTDVPLINIQELYLTYKQGNYKVVEKTLDDVILNPEEFTIEVHLTQEETLMFSDQNWSWLNPNENLADKEIRVQLRILYEDGEAIVTDTIIMTLQDILKDGEI